jgi:aryl-alcohol dehydrogenase-like predicted oxidoreductase
MSALPARRLGSQGPEITSVGFGAWAIGGPSGPVGLGKVDDAESIAAIRLAIESGVNWVDTAPAYGLGHSEEVVGRAVEPYSIGEEVLLFTKCGIPWDGSGYGHDATPKSIRRDCEASLRRLSVERIDLLQIHWPDWLTGTPVEESWGTLASLVGEGKVRWVGVSNFDVDLLARCEAIRHVDSLQPPLSLLKRGARDELIPWCARNGTGVIVYSPLATGLLTGTYDRWRLASMPAGDARVDMFPDFREPRLGAALALVDRLRPIADRLGTTLTALSVAWTLAVPGVTGAIVGARRAAQVGGWLPAAALELDAETLAEIDRAIAETHAGDDDPPATRI